MIEMLTKDIVVPTQMLTYQWYTNVYLVIFNAEERESV